jgi:hypothetical protein
MELSLVVSLILVFLFLFVFTYYLVRFYAQNTIPGLVFSAICISWYFGFSLCLLLPLDLLPDAETYRSELKFFWNLIYWFSFIGCWSFLPGMQSYYGCGAFNTKDKFIIALKENIMTYVVLGIIFAVFLIYVAAVGAVSLSDIPGFVVCLSNTWGLFLSVLMLGFGLVGS